MNVGFQHHVSPLQRLVWVDVGIECARRLDQAGQQGGLLPVELGGVDAEVRPRGVLHPERAVAEEDEVEVTGEDLGLGERLVQRESHSDLAQLARRRGLHRGAPLGVGLRGHQQLVVLHVLLLDRRPATGIGVAGEVAVQAGQCALPVHAVVGNEALVLDRDDCQLHRVGDLVGAYFEPALAVQPGDRVARRVDHRRHLRNVALDELSGAVGDDVGCAVGQQPDPAGEREHQPGRDDAGQQAAPQQLDDRHPRRRQLRHVHRLSAAPDRIRPHGARLPRRYGFAPYLERFVR